MRRLAVENAQLGMILARAIYDGSGNLILDTGTVLDTIHLPVLPRLDVKEIIIQDSRVDDVIIVPSISEETEAHAIRLLHKIIDSNRGTLVEHIKLDMASVDRVIKEIIQDSYNIFLGEINIEGCISPGNFDYIHPVKTTSLSILLGKKMGLNKNDLTLMGISAFLMNIGYIGVSQGILTSLDPEAQSASPEFRKHVETGARLIKLQKDVDPRIVDAVMQHHELWNGTGYQNKIKGKQINLFARIIAVASNYHSLISNQRNRKAYTPPEAAEYISAYSGEYFDPEVVQCFMRNVPFYPKGVMVRLNNGEIGVVTDSNIGYIGRVKVRIFFSRDMLEVPKPYDVDLSKPEHQHLTVAEILGY
ncbi:MAG TPA: HD domain-containing phosphohydrolase [Dehalococcoidales bacterium]|nr:HD domain-containing phosphohydrolase [Dehalococcoidales bacterium]